MAKKKYLILLTKQFPFQQREQYVAHELAFLAKGFEKVFIYPHDHFNRNDQPQFELPANVEVIDLNHDFLPSSKWEVGLSFFKAFWFEFFRTHDKIWFLKNVVRFYSIYATQFSLGNGLMRWLRKEKISEEETVFYSYWFSASALCLAILRSRKSIPSYVSRAHALDLYHEDWGLLNERVRVLPFRNLKQRYVDVIYSITRHGKDYLNRKYPDIKEVKVAYLGVNDVGLNPEMPEGRFVIATCSGVDDNKRIHLLGKALSEIDLPVLWIHFGDGPLKDKALASVTSSNVELRYMGQTLNREVRKFYSSHHVDLFVNISKVEGLPVTIMEALSHGIPALATDANGTGEAVISGETGLLIPVDFTDEQLREGLIKLMNSPELLAYRKNARKKFELLFDANKNYASFTQELLR